MCRVLELHPSGGFYAWVKTPESARVVEDRRLLGQIKQFWIESGFSYGYRTIKLDMKDHGETCGKNRVYRIMKCNPKANLVIDALMMTHWRRKPKDKVLIHPGPSVQYAERSEV